jgi:N-acetylmuramoyl-L-alanine amidase
VVELIIFLRSQYGNLPLRPHRFWTATACPGVWDLDKLDQMANAKAAVGPESTTVTPESKPTTPTPTKEEKMLVITQAKGDPAIWIGDGVSRRHIPDPKTLADYQKLASWGVLSIYKNGEIQNFPPETLGADVASQKIEAVQAEAIAVRAAALVKAAK